MIDEERVMAYAEIIGRCDIEYILGPEHADYPLPDADHGIWENWKNTAARVIEKADREHPPPPGSTQRKLPDHILALIVPRPYTSTACETARSLQSAIVRHPDHKEELAQWRDEMHDYCRENHKFTNRPCTCGCHNEVS